MKSLMDRVKEARDRGVALVEAAVVLPVIIVIAIGLSEVGFAVIDWLAVSNASREGARVGAAAGDFDDGSEDADDLIKSVVAQASCAIENGNLVSIRVFQSDIDGNQVGTNENIYTLDNVNYCSSGTAIWTTTSLKWPACGRNDSVGNLDILAVEVTFDHDSLTGFMPFFNATWTDTSIMRIEPDIRGQDVGC
jgi:hypothetical protein